MLKTFEGYKSVKFLKDNGFNCIPKEKGVYVVIRENLEYPEFLEDSIGGHFKNKDPTVPIIELEANWINNEKIIYIGQAGGNNSKATLKKRLTAYIKYGMGRPIGHQGGRYIWQLKDSDNLIIAWKITREDPYLIETRMINEFKEKHGKRPFANLKK